MEQTGHDVALADISFFNPSVKNESPTGGEIVAAVMASHAIHLPTHSAATLTFFAGEKPTCD